MQRAAGARRKDAAGEQQFEQADQHAEAAVQGERLQRLRFEHAPEQLAGALAPHGLDVAAQRAGQQP